MHPLPKGFSLAVANAKFRQRSLERNDIGLVLCDHEAVVAGVFTKNLFKAAPVLVSQSLIKKALPLRGVLINSGQANACTGDEGMANCLESLGMVESLFALPKQSLLPASTGVIGDHMDMEKWKNALDELEGTLGAAQVEDFARAIITTDAYPKMASRQVEVNGVTVSFTAVAKGAGMICPNMATMLSVVLTDAKVSKEEWQQAFDIAVEQSFNRVSVDGDTSTNDSLYGFSSGDSGQSLDQNLLVKELTAVLSDVAYLLVKDGEGSTKVIHIRVHGAKNKEDAEGIARCVGHSQLVKTAMFGRDPNWGRIVAAMGRSGVEFDPMKAQLFLCGIEVFAKGCPIKMDLDTVFHDLLDKIDIPIDIYLNEGDASSFLLASDLSHGYVSVNADYRT